jgi:hypothetical protein
MRLITLILFLVALNYALLPNHEVCQPFKQAIGYVSAKLSNLSK